MATIAANVIGIERNTQPIVWYDARGGNHDHIPDYRIETFGSRVTLYEVKDEEELTDELLANKWSLVARFAANQGVRWRLAKTSDFRDPIALAAAREMNEYGPASVVEGKVVEAIRQLRPSGAISVQLAAAETGFHMGEVRASLMHLAAWGELRVDLFTRIDEFSSFRWA
jgi:hypothetical protein